MNKGTKRLETARGYIRENWEKESDREIAVSMEITKQQVREIRARLGLKRSKENQKRMQAKGFNKSGWKRK